jgi:thiosulfate reductase/polysulfide reductase chain A
MAGRSEEELKSTCKMDHSGCGVLVHTEEGRVTRVEGNPQCPINQGTMCAKGLASIQQAYHPDRLKHPLKRAGERGEGKWKRISWDEALDTIARRLNEIKKEHGAEAVCFGKGTGRNEKFLLYRLANLFGTPNFLDMGYVCYLPRVHATQITCGGPREWGTVVVPDYDHGPKCIVLWGSQIGITNVDGLCGAKFLKAWGRGARLIVVDPRFTSFASKADLWLQIRPGTDAALALGMLNVIVQEGLYDEEFVENWTVGFDKLAKRVQDYSVEKVSDITWIPAEKIKKAARMYATLKPACMQWGVALEHNINAFQNMRSLLILMGVTGNIDVPGGNVFWVTVPLKRPELWDALSPQQAAKRLGADKFKVLGMLPIPCLHPPTLFRAILTGRPYSVKALILFASNALSTHPNAKEVMKALRAIDFFVVVDIFMTPTAEIADIVLPAATWLERDEIQFNPPTGWCVPVRQKAMETGECWSDWKIILELIKRLGLESKDLYEFIDETLSPANVNFIQLKEKGWITAPMRYRKYETDGFPGTPSGRFEIYSTTLENWGYDPLPSHVEPPESPVGTPKLAEQYPLILITGGRLPVFFHSEHRQIPWLREIAPHPSVEIHPEAAENLGVREGDWVFIESPRGRCKMKAKLTLGIDPRVVHAEHGWWFPERLDPEHGVWESNINMLTDNEPCDCFTGSNPLRALLCKVYKAT